MTDTDEPRAGVDFYDDEEVFDSYRRPRNPSESPVHTMEAPAFEAMVGDVSGMAILELGCGEGELGVDLLDRGASRYVGVDSSARMVESARARLAGRAVVERADLAAYRPQPAEFDLVVSLRVFHYLPDLPSVLGRAAIALRPGGRLVYSHEHPVITSFDERQGRGKRAAWTVDDYFRSGPRDVVFLGARVTKYHRTIEEHVDAVRRAGLTLSDLSECPPVRNRFGDDEAEYQRRQRIPILLMLAGTKPR